MCGSILENGYLSNMSLLLHEHSRIPPHIIVTIKGPQFLSATSNNSQHPGLIHTLLSSSPSISCFFMLS